MRLVIGHILALIIFIGCGQSPREGKKESRIIAPHYMPGHARLLFEGERFIKSGPLKDLIMEVAKNLREGAGSYIYTGSLPQQKISSLALGTRPEVSAIEALNTSLVIVDGFKKEKHKLTDSEKQEVLGLELFLKDHLNYYQAKVESDYIDIKESLMHYIWYLPYLLKVHGEGDTALSGDVLNSLGDDHFSQVAEKLVKIILKKNFTPTYSDRNEFLGDIHEDWNKDEFISPERVKGDIAYLKDNLLEFLPKELIESYIDAIEEDYYQAWTKIRKAMLKKKRFIKRKPIPMNVYSALLKTHGVYMEPNEMFEKAQSALKAELIELEDILNKIQAPAPAAFFTELRETSLIQTDLELEQASDSATQNILKIIKTKEIVSTPYFRPAVFFAGLRDNQELKNRSSNGVPQMISSMEGLSEKPFVLWPSVEVMREKGPDFCVRPAIHPITAHEGRPGHELQYVAMHEFRTVLPVRSGLTFNTANIEGWALYAEKLIETALNPAQWQLKAYYKFESIFRVLRVITDYKYNLGLANYDELADLYVSTLGVDRKSAENEMDRRVFSPGRDTGYFIGREEIFSIKKFARKRLGPKYNEKCFNNTMLRFGMLPQPLIKKTILKSYSCESPFSE